MLNAILLMLEERKDCVARKLARNGQPVTNSNDPYQRECIEPVMTSTVVSFYKAAMQSRFAVQFATSQIFSQTSGELNVPAATLALNRCEHHMLFMVQSGL